MISVLESMATVALGTRPERLARYREARRRGADWLLHQANPDGSLGDPTTGWSAYRAPWTLSLVGETEAALAYCA